MNYSISILLLIWYYLLLPVLLGSACCKNIKVEHKLPLRYVLGFVIEFAVFQIIYVPMRFMDQPVSRVTGIFNGVLVLLALLGIKTLVQEIRNGQKLFTWQRHSIWFYVALVIIGFQVIRYLFFYPGGGTDDVSYIPMIQDMVYTNRFYHRDIVSGITDMNNVSRLNYKYVFSGYYPYCAAIAMSLKINPLILCKVVMCPVYVICFYITWYEFAKWISDKKAEFADTFLLFFVLIAEFSAYSIQTMSKRLLLYAWNGKGAMSLVVMPYLLLICWRLLSEKQTLKQKVLILLVVISATGCSLMGGLMAPATVAIVALICAWRKRKLYVLWQAFLILLPSVVYLGVILLYHRGYIHL